MDIEIKINTLSLGENTEAQLERFSNELQAKTQAEYPDARVYIHMSESGGPTSVIVSGAGDDVEEICDNVEHISEQVFSCGAWHTPD